MLFWRVVLAAGMAMVLATGTGTTAAQEEASPYGKKMVRSYELPADLLDRYNEAIRSQAAGGGYALAATEAWIGSGFTPMADGNPHTLVVKVIGFATDDADSGMRWQPYWNGAAGSMPGMGLTSAWNGQPLQIMEGSAPMDFREGREVVPTLRLASAKNVRLQRVRVEIWSGVGETSWLDLLSEYWTIPVGIAAWTALLLFLRHERRKEAASAAAGAADPAAPGDVPIPADEAAEK